MSITDAKMLNRLKFWMIYLVISFVVMLASLESQIPRSSTDPNDSPRKRLANRDWCITCSIVTFTLTCIILIVHFLTNFPIIGGKLEGFSIIISVICWCALVIVVSQPGSGVAINGSDGSVANGNIYYFSWAGFLTSAVLLVSFVQHAVNVYVPNDLSSSRFKYWATLCASSIVVLGSSADIFGRICDGNGGNNYCNRCILGIVVGSFSTLCSLVVTTLNITLGHVPFLMECAVTTVIFALNAFGVAFLTSDKGPGAPLGNLYYFSWLSFVLVMWIGSSCYEDYKLAQDSVEKEEIELEESTVMQDAGLSQNTTMRRDNTSSKVGSGDDEMVDLEK